METRAGEGRGDPGTGGSSTTTAVAPAAVAAPAPPPVPESLKRLVDGSVDATVIVDRAYRVHHHNAAWQALTGLRPRALAQALDGHGAGAEAGSRCHELLHLEVCGQDCVMRRAVECGKPIRMDEVRARRGDGEEVTLIVTAVAIDEHFTVESYRDVTAESRVQRKYHALLERERIERVELERAVEEATAELREAQEQLVIQEKMSSLGRLVAGIAHELNNPINFVYGNVGFLGEYFRQLIKLVDLLESIPLPDEARAAIEEHKRTIDYDFLRRDWEPLLRSVRAGAERTAQIVADLKTFSRPQLGVVSEMDLVAGIETTLNLMSPLLRDSISVRRDLAPALPIRCRGGQVQQVVMNLLTNAAHAAGRGGWIAISAWPDGDGARIAVRDSGPGVPEEARGRIFDPFFTTKEPGQGTGLGLAISARIVRAHGGRIELTSQPGQSAEFTVWLPQEPRGEEAG